MGEWRIVVERDFFAMALAGDGLLSPWQSRTFKFVKALASEHHCPGGKCETAGMSGSRRFLLPIPSLPSRGESSHESDEQGNLLHSIRL